MSLFDVVSFVSFCRVTKEIVINSYSIYNNIMTFSDSKEGRFMKRCTVLILNLRKENASVLEYVNQIKFLYEEVVGKDACVEALVICLSLLFNKEEAVQIAEKISGKKYILELSAEEIKMYDKYIRAYRFYENQRHESDLKEELNKAESEEKKKEIMEIQAESPRLAAFD